LSGITYKIICWANEARPNLLPALFTEALRLGTHPWMEAKVVIIPKPGKTDYSAPKAYWPISLLECAGKVLKKVVAARLGSDVDHHHLIPSSQFGSHHYHSATDAATMLRYKAETTIKAGRIRAVLLMDISHFFDSLRPSIMSHILHHLGVDDPTIRWVHSLMADCTVRIQVKDFSLEGFQPGNSTPQGSPPPPSSPPSSLSPSSD
jgi:Reverse transcriptase (RNA-dependent DNA polymerase)